MDLFSLVCLHVFQQVPVNRAFQFRRNGQTVLFHVTEIQILEQISEAFFHNIAAKDENKIYFQNAASLNCNTGIDIIMQICAKPAWFLDEDILNLMKATSHIFSYSHNNFFA